MSETRRHLQQLARHARLFVDCARRPAEGEDTSGCVVLADDSHMAQLESALAEAETHLQKGGGPS